MIVVPPALFPMMILLIIIILNHFSRLKYFCCQKGNAADVHASSPHILWG